MRSSGKGGRALGPAAQRVGDQARDVLLQFRAQVLHQGRLDGRTLARRQLAGDRQRQGAQHRHLRQEGAQQGLVGGVQPAVGAAVRQPALQQRDGGIQAFRPAALERQFGVDLGPARALLADERVRRQLDVVEEHFGEMRVAGQILDRPDGHARQRQVDDELRQALVTVLRRARGARQRDHVVRAVRIGGPDLAAVQAPAARHGLGAGADAGQVGARAGLAHADAEEGLGAADARQVEGLLRRRAELEDQRRALAVGDPVRRHRCARTQQFLGQHEAREMAAPGAAVFARQRQAEPAAFGQLAAETGVVTHPGAGAFIGFQPVQRVGQEGAYVGAQRLVLRGDGGQFQRFDHGGSGLAGAGAARRWPLSASRARAVQ